MCVTLCCPNAWERQPVNGILPPPAPPRTPLPAPRQSPSEPLTMFCARSHVVQHIQQCIDRLPLPAGHALRRSLGRGSEGSSVMGLSGPRGRVRPLSFKRFGVHLDDLKPKMGAPSATPSPEEAVAIFAATWNVGEGAPTAANLKAWLPRARDVYAIGLQECLDVPGFAALAQHTLGGSARYALFQRSIGSSHTSVGYHVRC